MSQTEIVISQEKSVATAQRSAEEDRNASVAPLIELTHDDIQAVNAMILERAGSDVELIPEIANYLVSAGGKRLRPMITLASAAMFGYRGTQHIALACAVEFMHTATLLHDDVVDESDLRRGRGTARMIWGNQASVLVGDFLLGQAFRMMVATGSLDALDVLSTAASVIAEGEVWQLSAAKQLTTDETVYMKVIAAKTAALFEAAAEVGPIVAGRSAEEREALRRYGYGLGIAFQLVDDALDYGGAAADLGKNVGDDFREGKITLPVIKAYAAGSDEEKTFWRSAMEEGGNDDGALERAKQLLQRYSAIEDTLAAARGHGEDAKAALRPLPESPQKDALIAAVDFAIARAS